MTQKQKFSISYSYDVHFTRALFDPGNALLASELQKMTTETAVRMVVVVDKGVAEHHEDLSDQIINYCNDHNHLDLLAQPLVVKGGEECKNGLGEFMKVLTLINEAGVDRHAFLLAIGGGAVLDMAGFAAAVGHRGIRHIRIPTTVLSQNDSGVGVKNGINFFGKKNFLGTFAPPAGVFNDFDFLATLEDRDWRSGCTEAVKVALIKDAGFFEWLEEHAVSLKNRDLSKMEKLITECARLHLDHISGSDDPFEMGSSRPLDFGHWAAHKLEQLSEFELKHGEAVAVGLALDVTYARIAGYIDVETCDRIIHSLVMLGLEVFHPLLLTTSGNGINPDLLLGLNEFREHLGGQLTIPMISSVGEKFDIHDLNPDWIEQAALTLGKKKELYAY